MNILVTGANEQLGNEMRIVSKNTTVHYVFTDVNLVEGQETTYLDFTDMDISVQQMTLVERALFAVHLCGNIARTQVVQFRHRYEQHPKGIAAPEHPEWRHRDIPWRQASDHR